MLQSRVDKSPTRRATLNRCPTRSNCLSLASGARVSQLFFAGDRVVKIKRAVDYGFVNHLSLESRHQSCLDEVRLNRLLSDGVYLACEPIVDAGGGTIRFGGEGEPVEWATLMRLLPGDAMLDVLIERGRLPSNIGE